MKFPVLAPNHRAKVATSSIINSEYIEMIRAMKAVGMTVEIEVVPGGFALFAARRLVTHDSDTAAVAKRTKPAEPAAPAKA